MIISCNNLPLAPAQHPQELSGKLQTTKRVYISILTFSHGKIHLKRMNFAVHNQPPGCNILPPAPARHPQELLGKLLKTAPN